MCLSILAISPALWVTLALFVLCIFSLWAVAACRVQGSNLTVSSAEIPLKLIVIMSSTFESASLNFTGSLVDVTALTALIGSSTAESLMLGNKGAAGLVWATMSMFGVISIVRACIAATTPGWLRGTLGLRSSETDGAVGWSLELQTSRKSRNLLGSAIGIACEVRTMHVKVNFCLLDGEPSMLREIHPQNRKNLAVSEEKMDTGNIRDVYAFDQYTADHLGVLPYTELTDPLTIHLFTPDPFNEDRLSRTARNDMLGLLGSVVKLIEVGVLWRYRAYGLCWLTGLNWAFFFLGGLAVILLRASRESHENDNEKEWDILTGQLPTAIKPGGHRKVLLGAPRNVRNYSIWKVVRGLGGLVCLVSVIGSYLFLQRQDTLIFYIWTSFQLLWLFLRSVFFHFSEGTDKIFHHPIVIKKDWKELSLNHRTRIRHLVFALSRYQTHVHPRGSYCYTEDLQSVSRLDDVEYEFPLEPMKEGGVVKIYIDGVIGDTVLSSATWTFGAGISGMDLYDSCIVRLKIKGTTISIPSARVLTDTRPRNVDVEFGKETLRPPRGGSNTGQFIAWWYWIPCGNGRWLQMHTDGMRILGERQARVVSDEQITALLQGRELFVSIQEVEEVREIVRRSTKGCDVLCNILR